MTDIESELDRIASGAAAMGVALEVKQCRRLLAYIVLLDKWNRAYNLTGVRTRAAMVGTHLFDSLSALPHLQGSRVIDVGSGAGLPGIPLAIACPERQFVVLDSNGKKTRFCAQAAGELELDNVAVERTRVEDYRPARPFDTVISRAFADLGRYLEATRHLVGSGGRLLAMKGRLSDRELADPPNGFSLVDVRQVDVPEVDAQRHILEIKPDG